MKKREPVFVYGAGGHGKVVAEILELTGYEIAAVMDDDEALRGSAFLNHRVRHTVEALEDLNRLGVRRGIVAIGNNAIREMRALSLREKGFELVGAIHSSAIVSTYAKIGAGCAVMAGAIVNPGARVDDLAILNTGCSVDHDCRIGEAAHIAPGARLGGSVTVGARALVGTGAAVVHNCRIGADAVIGAGAAVIGDIPGGVTAVGVPARVIKT